MLPPSLAFAWLFWRQYRDGAFLAMGYLLLAGALSSMLAPYCAPGTAEGVLGLFGSLTVSALSMYLLGVFTYGFEGADVFVRESCFPARLFRLPVSTGSLVLWPMVYGAMASILLWPITASLILRPWLQQLDPDAVLPLWWPAVFTAAVLAWVQALLWSPFGLVGFRCILFAVLIPCLTTLAVLGAKSGAAEMVLVAIYAGFTLVAWALSYIGVRHARRGDVPDWHAVLWPLRQLALLLPRRRLPFDSAANAQTWFEWRLTGITLPFMTGLGLIAALLPLLLGKNDVLPSAQTLLTALALPVYFAGFSGGWPAAGRNPWVKDRSGIMPFIATLPMTNAELVGAMLKAAVWTTLATWAVVAVIVSLAVVLTGNLEEVTDWWRQALRTHSLLEMIVGLLATTTLLLVWTWKRKVDFLYHGITGRYWIQNSLTLASLPGSISVWVLAVWICHHPESHETTLTVLPGFLGALIVCRLMLAGWALREGLHRGLVRPATVRRWVAGWLLLTSLLIILLAWSVPTEAVPVYYLAFAVLFAMPMTRLAAAPLALAWNRHR